MALLALSWIGVLGSLLLEPNLGAKRAKPEPNRKGLGVWGEKFPGEWGLYPPPERARRGPGLFVRCSGRASKLVSAN